MLVPHVFHHIWRSFQAYGYTGAFLACPVGPSVICGVLEFRRDLAGPVHESASVTRHALAPDR